MNDLFRSLGIYNQYKELQTLNIIFLVSVVRTIITPHLEGCLLTAVIAVLIIFKWHFDAKIKKGMWGEIEMLKEQNKSMQETLRFCLKTQTETGDKLAHLSNKIAFTK